VDGRDKLAPTGFIAGQETSAHDPPLEQRCHDRSEPLG
jgi:hypothetical protein